MLDYVAHVNQPAVVLILGCNMSNCRSSNVSWRLARPSLAVHHGRGQAHPKKSVRLLVL